MRTIAVFALSLAITFWLLGTVFFNVTTWQVAIDKINLSDFVEAELISGEAVVEKLVVTEDPLLREALIKQIDEVLTNRETDAVIKELLSTEAEQFLAWWNGEVSKYNFDLDLSPLKSLAPENLILKQLPDSLEESSLPPDMLLSSSRARSSLVVAKNIMDVAPLLALSIGLLALGLSLILNQSNRIQSLVIALRKLTRLLGSKFLFLLILLLYTLYADHSTDLLRRLAVETSNVFLIKWLQYSGLITLSLYAIYRLLKSFSVRKYE